MTEREEKAAFAALLLKEPKEPFKMACELFPGNTARALRAATEWPNDPEVIAAKERLLEEVGEMGMLPGKAELAREVWDKMQKCFQAEDFAKLAKLYADIRGFIDKPNQGVTINQTNNRVMVVKDQGSDAAWEKKLAAQQKALLHDANAPTIKH